MPRDFKVYDLLAIHAGHEIGLADVPDVAAASALGEDQRAALAAKVADHPQSAAYRDKLTEDLDRRLCDQGYSGQQVWEWFKATYGPISRTAIYRARYAARAHGSKIAECAAQAQAYMDLAGESGADGVFAATSQRAGQLIFQLLMEANATTLGGEVNLRRMTDLVHALSVLQRSRAETDLVRQKLAELVAKFDRQVADERNRAAGAGGSLLSDESIQRVREAVFGRG